MQALMKPANFGFPGGMSAWRLVPARERHILLEILAVWSHCTTVFFLVCLIATLLSGCVTEVVEPEDVVGPDDLVDIAESYCRSDPTLTCGKVYGFPETPAENPIGMLELCIPWPDSVDPLRPTLAQAEAEYGPSILSPDPRFDSANLCWWQCPSMRGCNSYSGCYCPAP